MVRAVIFAISAAHRLDQRASVAWPVYRLGPAGIGVPEGVPVLETDDVCIIGRLFHHRTPVTTLSRARAGEVIASKGAVLVESFWGSYLALWRDRLDGAVHVLRDPSGAVPLFRMGQGARAVFFTDLEDVWPMARMASPVDWTGVAHHLLYPQAPTARTALQNITAILPGQSTRFDGLDPPRLVWSPWRFAERGASPSSLAAAAVAVRNAVETATAALVPKTPVMLELSGGLDSSILAACLDRAKADWTAVTISTPAADGDERHFAEAVTDRFGASLRTLALTPADLDLLAPPRVRTTAPAGFGMLAGLDRAIAALAEREGCTGLISGTGGDNVFCSLRSPAPVLDAWCDRGLGRAIRTAGDLGRLTASNHWTVLRQTFRYAARDRQRPDRWTRDISFLARDCRPMLEPHPWFAAPAGRRAGRRAHIVLLLRAHAVAAAHERARRHAMQLPLLAQPVVETCLEIPAWQWIAGGRDRAVARIAFADWLPDLIIARRSKGRLESLLAPAYDRDRLELRDRLADGRLAAAGVIDRDAVIAAFAPRASGIDDVYIRLLELADAEFWLASVA